MLIDFQNGQTGVILRVKVRQDNTGVKPGQGFTGLANTSAGLIVSTIADTESVPTVYTQAGATIDAITTLGTYAAPATNHCAVKKVDDANNPGVVEIQLANARYAVSSAKSLLVSLSGVTGMADCDVAIPLRAVNPYDGQRGGLAALPNAAAGSTGGIQTTAQLVTAVWTDLATGSDFAAANSIGLQLKTNVDATTSSRATPTGVWDQAVTGHTTSGTFGGAMQAAGSAGDPWATALPGSYPNGSAGSIVGAVARLQITGKVTAVTSASSFTVQFDSPYNGTTQTLTAGKLWLSFTGGANFGEASLITGGTLTDSTHASPTFNTAFPVAPAVNDTVALVTN